MNITDRRIFEAQSWEDFRFRLGYEESEYISREPFQAVATAGFVSPDPSKVWGIDTSHWDGNVNYYVTKEKGGAFAIIKCQSGTIETKYWRGNRATAIAAGLITGEYFWLYPDNVVSCSLQAKTLWQRIKDLPKQLPVTVDFEWTKWNGQNANPTYTDLQKWVDAFTSLSGYKPMLYSAAGYMNAQGRMPDALKRKFCAFWFANYGVTKPMLPFGFTDWDFWQFTSSGDAAGLAPGNTGKKELDLNYWNGSLEELQTFAGVLPSEPPAPKKTRITIVIDGAYTITEEKL